jgi:hypothetical protein
MHFAGTVIEHLKERGTMWQAWMTGILGIWLIIASFTISGNIMNQLIVGVAIAVLGFWGAARIQL